MIDCSANDVLESCENDYGFRYYTSNIKLNKTSQRINYMKINNNIKIDYT